MKKSEKLLDAIGQIDDKLVEEAANAGRAGDMPAANKRKSQKRSKKTASIHRWQGALAACAVLAVCVGIFGLLNRAGLIFGPYGSGSAELTADTTAGEVAGAAAGRASLSEGAAAEAENENAGGEQPALAAEAAEDKAAESSAEDNAGGGSGAEAAYAEKEDGVVLAENQDSGTLSVRDELSKQSDQMQERAEAAVIVTVKESSEKSVTFVVENGSDREILFGKAFALECLAEEGWQTVEPDTAAAWEDVEIVLGAGETYEETVVLDSFYRSLPAGQYRLAKSYQLAAGKEPEELAQYPMYAEFTIEQ